MSEEHDEQIAAMEDALEIQQQRNNHLESKNRDLQYNLSEAERKVSDLESDLHEAKDRISEIERERASLESVVSDLRYQLNLHNRY